MKTKIIRSDFPEAISQALSILRRGGLVALPTDTVYGVGSLAFNGKAVESIYAAKDRPIEKAIPILIGDPNDFDKVAVNIPDMARKLAARFWPGPLTLVVPKNLSLPDSVSATETVGVRMPDHPVAIAVLRAVGPMAVTSANISGQPSPVSAEEVSAQLGGRIELIIDAGATPGGIPSTLVDCTSDEPKILRTGPLTLEDIQSALDK
jgi:L-threonylcarbamoyladenylate synthase